MSLTQTIEQIVSSCGVQLYDTEVTSEGGRKIFRIYITATDGVTLEKCAEISHILSPIFDLEPPLEDEYTLEISSPGIERPLKNLKHFQASIGEILKVKLINTDKIIGKLEKVSDKEITLLENDGEITTIAFDEIAKARTYFEW
ncbi:MAG: ribosome maturation factor RimP [Sulfurospirillum sp.]|nr:ribosome maturation factor RimP [Sulfurospirillum sp.]